ncbi:MAG: hypothetical protein ACJ790_02815 [Myxococcaceae bacterium]
MKTLLWIALFLFGLTGVLFPAIYLYTASKLPQLDSDYDLETLLRLSVEGERMSVALGLPPKERGFVAWPKPELANYPKDFVALYLSQFGCPNYFKAPRETGVPWAMRLIKSTWGSGLEGDPGGACEFLFASRLAQTLGIKGGMDVAVAVNKIHTVLQKDQLIAYDMSSSYVSHGVVGVEQAVTKTLHKELKDMNLAELSEAALVVPPNYLFDEVRTCNNAALIKRARDVVIEQLKADELISEAQASNAEAAPVACLKTP